MTKDEDTFRQLKRLSYEDALMFYREIFEEIDLRISDRDTQYSEYQYLTGWSYQEIVIQLTRDHIRQKFNEKFK